MSSFFWWIREHVGGIALVIALAAAGAGAAGVVMAMDAQDQAEEAADAADEAAASSSTTVPEGDINSQVQSSVDELNERVAQIEESVASLRTEISTTSETTTTEDTTTDTTTPELPEGIPDLPGTGAPESEAP